MSEQKRGESSRDVTLILINFLGTLNHKPPAPKFKGLYYNLESNETIPMTCHYFQALVPEASIQGTVADTNPPKIKHILQIYGRLYPLLIQSKQALQTLNLP